MIKNKTASFVIFVVVAVVFWNILELIYSSFITKSGYQFDPAKSLGTPAVISIMVGYLLFLRNRESK